MRKILSTLILSLVATVMLLAQAPQTFSYQTVVRDNNWQVIQNQSIGVKVAIIEDVASGTTVYEEEHTATTNDIGLINLAIGGGSISQGAFANIDWGNHDYFMKISVDISGGTTYIAMGTTQLRSVPYALFAETSGTPGTPGLDGIDGTNGLDGVDGTNGTNGVDGTIGLTGSQGIQGLQGDTGIAGTNGVDGNDGLNGLTGAQGIQGLQGDTGIAGTNGVDGIDGNDGAQGIQGIAGNDGTNGTNGVDGAVGATGLTGAAGTNGTIGLTGVQGIQGIQGLQGTTGLTGAQGIQGATGNDGTNGNDGVDGLNGATGTNGVDGIDGADGAVGATGLTGTAGTNGTNGTNGANGTNGVDGIDGNDGAAGTNGTNGIDGIDGNDGTTGLTGAQGIQGITGTNGANGLEGAVGATGAIGLTGNTGADGTNGANGLDGAAGATGGQGAIGLTGNTGAAGTNGANGLDGAAGATGGQGAIGLTGNTGAAGTNGANGTDGLDGAVGGTGLTGATGTNGTNGIDGAVGTTGLTGDAGTDGTNGIAGVNGVDGYSPMFGVDYFNGQDGAPGTNGNNGIDGVDGIDAVLNYDSLANIISADSSFAANVSGGIGGGCDILYPDGLDGEPITHNLSSSYTVPSGKNLYITNLYISGYSYSQIDGITIGYGYSNHNETGNSMPLILNEGQVMSTSLQGSFNGFLIDVIIEPITHDLNSIYTVPSGKKLYITNLYISGYSYSQIDGITIGYGYSNHNETGNSMPLILNEGQVMSTSLQQGSFNGYLVDEDYFANCGGGGSSSTAANTTIDSLTQVVSTLDSSLTALTSYFNFGCTDVQAINYNSLANIEDNSCILLGAFYQGGVIFYLDGNGGGLICDIQDLGTAEWGCNSTNIGTTGQEIGTGMQNTVDIELGCTTVNTAADKCANSTSQGYTDWFLPSIDELLEIYQNKSIIDALAIANGGVAFDATNTYYSHYWSSSQKGISEAYLVRFYPAFFTGFDDKSLIKHVRAIRAF